MNSTKLINHAIEFIEINLYESITASDVAKSVSYSYFHFHRYFYSVMGETIGNYIRSRRLTQAAHDLNHSKKSILEISFSLGFETAESFTRAFKKRYFITPSAYRKRGTDVLIGNRHRAPIDSNGLNNLKATLAPKIVTISPVTIIGMRFKPENINHGYKTAWRVFNESLLQPFYKHNCYGVFEPKELCSAETFNSKNVANLFIGLETSDFSSLPQSYQIKKISGGKYAKFVHKGSVDSLLQTYQFIWGVWLMESNYTLDNREDFECYTDRFKGETADESEIDIYFPIQ